MSGRHKRKAVRRATGPAAPPDGLVNADAEMCEKIGCTAGEFAQYAVGAQGQKKWTEISTEYERLQERVVQARKEGHEFPEGIPPYRKYLFLVHWPSLRMKHINETASGEGEGGTGQHQRIRLYI